MIDNFTHAYEVFKTLYILHKDTLIIEGLGPQSVPLVEHVDTTCEQHVDDLTASVKHVVLGD